MAVTGNKQRNQENQAQYQSGAYNGLKGVSQSTGQKLNQYQNGYKPSAQVQTAQQNLQQIQAQKPQGYTSKYGPQLESIMQQIQNPGQFNYEFNGDNLFKNYADLYTQMGKQAMMDTMANATALTGGYGNSYAQSVGQQQYQQNLLPLYDRGMELRDRAYEQYRDRIGDLYNQYGLMQGADDTAYGRYRDTVGDWERQEENAYGRMIDERNFDYNDYNNMLNYYSQLAQIENADYNTEQDRQEAIREFNERMAEQIRGTNLDEAYRRDTLAEQIRGTDLDEAYRRDTLAEQVRQANMDEGYRRDTLAEQIRQANLDEAYRQQNFDWNKETDARDYAEAVLRANQDEAYRRDTLAQQMRQSDRDEAYRQNMFNWNKSTDQRDYERSVMENDRAYYTNYAAQMLANGQMPSADILRMIGLSEADARKLIAQIQAGTGPDNPKPETDTGKPYTFEDANKDYVLSILNSNLTQNAPASAIHPSLASYGTVSDYKKAMEDKFVNSTVGQNYINSQKPKTEEEKFSDFVSLIGNGTIVNGKYDPNSLKNNKKK